MTAVPDEDDVLRLMEQVELLLWERHAQGRCCHTDCLHCPYGRKRGQEPIGRP
ncbi:MAG: hypothetical protein AB7H43_00840 [Acidimicrobiia bacterium]